MFWYISFSTRVSFFNYFFTFLITLIIFDIWADFFVFIFFIWTCFLIIPKISIWKKSKFDIWVFRTSNGSGTMGYGLRRPKKVVWASTMVLGLFCEPIISFSHILQFKSLILTNCSKAVLTVISLVPSTLRTSLLLKGPGSLVVGSGAELGISIIF